MRSKNHGFVLLLCVSSLFDDYVLSAPNRIHHLTRDKRSAEVTYGNEQNEMREKRIDPSAVDSKSDSSLSSVLGNGTAAILDHVTGGDAGDDVTNDASSDASSDPNGYAMNDRGATEVQAGNFEPSSEDDYTVDYNPGFEPIEARRRKRSAEKASAPLIAENMAAVGSVNTKATGRSRTKRHLDYAQVQRLLNGVQQNNDDEISSNYADDLEDKQELLDKLEAADELDADDADDAQQEKWLRVEERLAKHILSLDAQKRHEEKLLESMLKADARQEEEEEEEAEAEEENDEEDQRRMPKRYPYSYSPYDGYWGSMVPGEKRAAPNYERLYKLAQALNEDADDDNAAADDDNDDAAEEEEEK